MKLEEIRAIVACEESQVVTKELLALGVDAHSVDIQDCSGGLPERHIKDSIFHVLCRPQYSCGLDLLIGHPVCTFMTNSGVRWLFNSDGSKNIERWENLIDAMCFFRALYHSNSKHIALENPIPHKYARDGFEWNGKWIEGIGRPDQIIQPWMFGDGEQKATCLWLKNLPKLQWHKSDNLFSKKTAVSGREQRIFKIAPGPERTKLRSKTYPGIATAMATQWTEYLLNPTP